MAIYVRDDKSLFPHKVTFVWPSNARRDQVEEAKEWITETGTSGLFYVWVDFFDARHDAVTFGFTNETAAILFKLKFG